MHVRDRSNMFCAAMLVSAILMCTCSHLAYAQVSGGESGYDESLEALEPGDELETVGLAGGDPAEIGRYLLAENGGVVPRTAARLSPDGKASISLRVDRKAGRPREQKNSGSPSVCRPVRFLIP